MTNHVLRAGAVLSDEEFAGLFDKLRNADPSLMTSLKEGDLTALMDQWILRDFNGAMAALLRLPDDTLKKLSFEHFPLDETFFADVPLLHRFFGLTTEKTLRSWAARDYTAAEAWVYAQSDTPRREEMLNTLLLGHVDTLEKHAAIAFILERKDNLILQSELANIFCDLIESRDESAFARLRSIPADHPVWQAVVCRGFLPPNFGRSTRHSNANQKGRGPTRRQCQAKISARRSE